MKRSFRKLALNRETIGRLTDQRLTTAAGGSGVTCNQPTCDATCMTWCFVCPPSQATNCSLCVSDCDSCKC